MERSKGEEEIKRREGMVRHSVAITEKRKVEERRGGKWRKGGEERRGGKWE